MKAMHGVLAGVLAGVMGVAGCGGEAGRNPALRLRQTREVYVPMEAAEVLAVAGDLGPRGGAAVDSVKPHFTYVSARFGREDGQGILAFTSENLLAKGARYQVMGVADLYRAALADTVGSGLVVNPGAAGSFVASREDLRRALPLLPKSDPIRRRLATAE